MADALLGKTVRIRALRKSYGAVEVLHDINLNIGAGEFCTLLGASGSGKTTILKALAGFENIDGGAIEIDGNNIAGVPVAKRNIGMVFQNYALFPHMNVRRNVAFGLEMRKLSNAEIKSRVDDILRLVDLGAFTDRLPGALSGGQQQRVALARALVINPDILLMDEPLGALDKNLRQSIQLQLKKLHQELGITIVYVTHDQEEALHLSDRIVIMDKGKVVQNGTPRELYFSPVNAFVAGFLGECNFINNTVGQRIAVRPENLHLSPQNSDTHSVDAEIENVIFLGTSSKIVARQNDTQILAIVDNSVDHRDLVPRQPVRFHVAEKDILRL